MESCNVAGRRRTEGISAPCGSQLLRGRRSQRAYYSGGIHSARARGKDGDGKEGGNIQGTNVYQEPHIIVLSARTEDRLKAYALKLAHYLELPEAETASLRDIAYTLQLGREAFAERMAITAGSVSELKGLLDEFNQGRLPDGKVFRGISKASRITLSCSMPSRRESLMSTCCWAVEIPVPLPGYGPSDWMWTGRSYTKQGVAGGCRCLRIPSPGTATGSMR